MERTSAEPCTSSLHIVSARRQRVHDLLEGCPVVFVVTAGDGNALVFRWTLIPPQDQAADGVVVQGVYPESFALDNTQRNCVEHTRGSSAP